MRPWFRRCRALAVASAVALAATAEAQTAVDFRVPTGFQVGGTPADVAASDLDGNGALDLAVTNINVGTLSVLMGTGDGDFFPLDDVRVADAPTLISVARFDAGDTLDLIVTETESDFVYFLAGAGDGTFAEPEAINVGHDPAAISTVDMNGDGPLDLVIGLAAEGAGRVNVLLGSGDGSFSLDEENRGRRLPASCFAVGVGRFDADEHLDVVALAADNDEGFLASMLGDGSGAIARPTVQPATDIPLRLAVSDFDGDDALDLITADGNQNAASVWHGDGAGGFTKQTSYPVGAGPSTIQLADLDGDGRQDAITTDTAGGTVTILRGLEGGSFAAARHFSAPLRPFAVASGDFDGDDRLDLAVGATSDLLDQVLLLRGIPGGFAAVEALYPGSVVSGAAAAEFTGDDLPDLLASNGQRLELRAALATGGFAPPVTVADEGTGPIRVADVDGDDRLDVVAASAAQPDVLIRLARGDGSFTTAPVVGVLAPPTTMAVADLDGDGAVDIAAPSDAAEAVAVAFGNGDGTFGEAARIQLGGRPSSIASGDFDGDGHADLAIGNLQSGLVQLLLSRDGRTFDMTRTLAVGGLPFALAAGDIDLDGHADLAVAGNGPVRVFFGNGDATFANGVSLGLIGFDLALRDVTGDLLPDVLIANLNGNAMVVAPNVGNRRFGGSSAFTVGLRPAGVLAADFDADSRYDLVGRGSGAWVLTNTAAPSSRRGDANGDGAISAADLTPLAHALALAPSQPIESAAHAVDARGGIDTTGDGLVGPGDTAGMLRRLFGG